MRIMMPTRLVEIVQHMLMLLMWMVERQPYGVIAETFELMMLLLQVVLVAVR